MGEKKEKAEKNKLDREWEEKDRFDRDRLEKDRQEKERSDRNRSEKNRQERDWFDREGIEKKQDNSEWDKAEKKDAAQIQTPDKPDYEAELIKIIRTVNNPKEIRELLKDYHDNDIASVFESLTSLERRKLYLILGDDEISGIFSYLDDAKTYLKEMSEDKAADILESMDADDALDILEEMQDDKRKKIVELIEDEARQEIALIASYDEDEIGSKMTTNFVVIRNDFTIQKAMKSLVKQAADNDNISTIYVEDSEGKFYGAIELKDLIIARKNVKLESLISTSYPYVYASETVDECIEELKDYSEDSIPVLDYENHLLGVITSQDMVEVVDEEMGEDYAKLAGLSAEEDLEERLFDSLKKRIPWLVILLFLGMCVSSVVSLFEGVMAELTLMVSFQSLVLGMSGNVGTQSLAVTIRVLMDENLTLKNKFGLVFKELRIGFSDGLILGALAFGVIGVYIHLIKRRTMLYAFSISGCVGLAMLTAMMMASLTGTIIPIMFKKMKVDPAVASGPLITTINDLVSAVTYYGLAWIFLINIMKL